MGDPTYTNFVDTEGKTAQAPDNLSSSSNIHINNINDAADFFFPPHVLDNPTACLQRAFLSPRNVFVDEFNDVMLDALPGDYESYFGSRAGTSRRT
ncbi:hypothetical protein BDR05DRAFT_956213 [Suillus weaverae]|nr:hypothetical protein BDR05DRAFT_956213 [Suillus weaverae]